MKAIERLLDQVERHEGFRSLVYDDGTGKALKPGDTLVGHPTIGIGWALDRHPMRHDLARSLALDILVERDFDLRHTLPWVGQLNEVRQMALVELAYNLGVDGLLGFPRMLHALEVRDWHTAGEELVTAKWATQVQPARRDAIVHMLVTGEWL